MAEDGGRLRNELFELHFNQLPVPAYVWERDTRDFVLIAHNRAAAALSYSRAPELLGKTASELSTPEYAIGPDLARCIDSKTAVQREIELFFSTTGTLRPVRLTMVPLSSRHVVVHSEDLEERERTKARLEQSERLYGAIVDNAREGIWALDTAGVTIYVNPRAAEMLGYAREDMLGCEGLAFLFPEDHDEARELLRRTTYEGEPQSLDFRLRHKDGSTVWVAAAAAPVLDSTGTVTGVVVMTSDVTARREAEQRLRDSEQRLRVLLDSHPDSIMRVTRDGIYLDAHIMERERDEVPFRPEEVIGKRVDELFEPEFAARHAERRERALATGEIVLWEYDWQGGGATNHYEARFVASSADEVLVTVRNVTERKRFENALGELAGRLEALTEAAFDGVCIAEAGRVTEVSERLANMLGYAPDELIGKPTSLLFEVRTPTAETDPGMPQRSGPYATFGYRKDGDALPIDVCAAAIGEQQQCVYAIRDISRRTALQREIIDIGERERSRIGRDLHDGVGQTLTGVSLAMGSLAHKLAVLDPHLGKDVEHITGALQNAIGEVRSIAKALAPNILSAGFRRTLRQLVDEVDKYTHMRCRLDVPETCEIVDETAATHLYRIAQEGLQNAVRHSRGRNIELRCARQGRRFTLEIVDDGVGIAQDADLGNGTGMKNMRYRARSINGTLEIRAGAERGTHFFCRCYTRPAWFESP